MISLNKARRVQIKAVITHLLIIP